MTHFSLIGCQSGKSIRHMLPLIPARLLLLTELAQAFLSVHAQRLSNEVIPQAVQLSLTVHASYLAAISDGLTVRTICSALTREQRWNGQTLSRSTRDSRLFVLKAQEVTLAHPALSWHLLDTLGEISSKVEHSMNSSTFHVLTSQKIIHAAALPLPVRSFGQYPARQKTA